MKAQFTVETEETWLLLNGFVIMMIILLLL